MRVRVDQERCQGHTLCSMIAPNIFSLSEIDGTASAPFPEIPADQEDLVREAAQSCPEQAIIIEESRSRPSDLVPSQPQTGTSS